MTLRLNADRSEESARAPESPKTLAACSVLVVEDDLEVRETLEGMLRIEGHRVHGVADATQALECLASESFDLMITDHQMPGMTGAELARHLALERPELPVVLLTGCETSASPGNDRNVRAVLSKPLGLEGLRAALGEVFSD